MPNLSRSYHQAMESVKKRTKTRKVRWQCGVSEICHLIPSVIPVKSA
jgi:hypothetical protein